MRRSLSGSRDFLDNNLSCPPIILSVVEPGQANPPLVDPTTWSAGPWGPEVEGVQIRLSIEKTFHNPGAIPLLSLDVRNFGSRSLCLRLLNDGPTSFERKPWIEDLEIEVDGTWYQLVPNRWGEKTGLPLAPGNRYEDLHFMPEKSNWQSAAGQPPPLNDGQQHAFRVALTVQPADGGKPMRLVTNVLSPPSADKLSGH
jgi:hypothetical protein